MDPWLRDFEDAKLAANEVFILLTERDDAERGGTSTARLGAALRRKWSALVLRVEKLEATVQGGVGRAPPHPAPRSPFAKFTTHYFHVFFLFIQSRTPFGPFDIPHRASQDGQGAGPAAGHADAAEGPGGGPRPQDLAQAVRSRGPILLPQARRFRPRLPASDSGPASPLPPPPLLPPLQQLRSAARCPQRRRGREAGGDGRDGGAGRARPAGAAAAGAAGARRGS